VTINKNIFIKIDPSLAEDGHLTTLYSTKAEERKGSPLQHLRRWLF
jgi:hypothetical protein